jgi:hypothetical protein
MSMSGIDMSIVDRWFWCADAGDRWESVRWVVRMLGLPQSGQTVTALRSIPALEFKLDYGSRRAAEPVQSIGSDAEFVYRPMPDDTYEDNDGMWLCRVRPGRGAEVREAVRVFYARLILERL